MLLKFILVTAMCYPAYLFSTPQIGKNLATIKSQPNAAIAPPDGGGGNPAPSTGYYFVDFNNPDIHYRGNALFYTAPNYNPPFDGPIPFSLYAYTSNQSAVLARLGWPSDGTVLHKGDYLVSQDGNHKLIFQNDGNLCTYTRGQFTWGTMTQGRGATLLRMQNDGNLCLYEESYSPYGQLYQRFVWGTMSQDRGGFYCLLQNDGNFCIYTQGVYGTPANSWTGYFVWGSKN